MKKGMRGQGISKELDLSAWLEECCSLLCELLEKMNPKTDGIKMRFIQEMH